MSNMFKNAVFGDKFKTRDGRLAIYSHNSGDNYSHWLLIDGEFDLEPFTKSGDHNLEGYMNKNLDIISHWED